jgi:hypothetical protein
MKSMIRCEACSGSNRATPHPAPHAVGHTTRVDGNTYSTMLMITTNKEMAVRMVCGSQVFSGFYTSNEPQPGHPLKRSGSLRDKQESTWTRRRCGTICLPSARPQSMQGPAGLSTASGLEGKGKEEEAHASTHQLGHELNQILN